jgi:hypothetical protein
VRIVVTGGTGFIGSRLCRALEAAGHTPVVLTRDPARVAAILGPHVERRGWSPGQPGEWQQAFDGAEGVINLAGESIAAKRWSHGQKAAIRGSRLLGTRSVVEAMGRAQRRPPVLVSASASGYYGPCGDELVDESHAPGDDFLARVCQEWEQEAWLAERFGSRVVLVRTGVVLGPGGGALPRLLAPFKYFVGGPLGSGRQGFPWIHLDDVVSMYCWALENQAVSGPVNACGPESLTNREFCQRLAMVLGRPCWAPVPALALKLLLGEMAESLLLQGQRMAPARAEQLGYRFSFRTAEAALRQLLNR